MLLAAADDNECHFGHHCCRWASPNPIKQGKVKGLSIEGNFEYKFSVENTDRYLLKEIINQMKSTFKKTQKNYTGSRSQGPAASLPHTSALTQNKQRYAQYKHNNATEHNSSNQPSQETETRPGNKCKRRDQDNYKKDSLLQNSQSPPAKKAIQWSESETRSFNPARPVNSSLTTTTFATSPLFTQGTAWNPSHYPTALPPTYIAVPPPNYTTTVDGLHTPYHNQAYPGYHPQPPLFQQQHQWNNQRQILFHPHTENKKKNPFSN